MTPNPPEDKFSYPGNQRLSVIPARAIVDPNLPDGALRTLAAIGVFGDKNGWCFPSYSTLAKMRGVSKQAISKHVAVLVKLGYLNVHHRYNKETGAQQTNMLQIRFDYEPEMDATDEVQYYPRQRGVYPPSTSEVDGGSTSEVDGGSTSEVDAINLTSHLTTHINGGVNPRQRPVDVDGGSPPPPPPPSSKSNSANYRKNAERLYRKLRPSHLIIPRTRWYEEALQVLNTVLNRNEGDLEAAAEELRPYVEEADRRNISPTNLCWLTEWAASGHIPPSRYSKRNGSNNNAAQNDDFGDPYGLNLTPVQKANRRALAARIAKAVNIPKDQALELIGKYGGQRWVEILSLTDKLKQRGMATLEVFEFMAYLYVPIETFRRRLEQGAQKPEELFADYLREYQEFLL